MIIKESAVPSGSSVYTTQNCSPSLLTFTQALSIAEFGIHCKLQTDSIRLLSRVSDFGPVDVYASFRPMGLGYGYLAFAAGLRGAQ